MCVIWEGKYMALYRDGHRVDTVSNTSKIGCLLLSMFFIPIGILMFVLFVGCLIDFNLLCIFFLLMSVMFISSGITYFKEFWNRK